jgi:hypothetical protein
MSETVATAERRSTPVVADQGHVRAARPRPQWYNPPMRSLGPRLRRIGGVRLDHVLILVGCLVMTAGAVMPWIRGSTRMIGSVDWTGLDDSGEGAMFFAASLALIGAIRWRGTLAEISPRTRFIPLIVAIACALLWTIAFRKIVYLSWFEIAVGARPQPGLFIAVAGILIALAGAILAATDPESVAAARSIAEGQRQRSGAGGDGAASERVRRGGGGRPSSPDDYSVVGRVERVSSGDDGAAVDRGRG